MYQQLSLSRYGLESSARSKLGEGPHSTGASAGPSREAKKTLTLKIYIICRKHGVDLKVLVASERAEGEAEGSASVYRSGFIAGSHAPGDVGPICECVRRDAFTPRKKVSSRIPSVPSENAEGRLSPKVRRIESLPQSNSGIKDDSSLSSSVGSRVDLGGHQSRVAEPRDFGGRVVGGVKATKHLSELVVLHLSEWCDGGIARRVAIWVLRSCKERAS